MSDNTILRTLIKQSEIDEDFEKCLWFSLPGGLIVGYLSSIKRANIRAAGLVGESPGDFASLLLSREELAPELIPELRGEVEFSILDAIWMSGGNVVPLRSAFINLSAVSAWGPGTALFGTLDLMRRSAAGK